MTLKSLDVSMNCCSLCEKTGKDIFLPYTVLEIMHEILNWLKICFYVWKHENMRELLRCLILYKLLWNHAHKCCVCKWVVMDICVYTFVIFHSNWFLFETLLSYVSVVQKVKNGRNQNNVQIKTYAKYRNGNDMTEKL